MKTVPASLQLHMNQDVTSLAVCWLVTRLDGQVFGFTDHDQDLTFEAQLYECETGFRRTAINESATLSAGDMEVDGYFNDDAITERDLRTGKFDYAEVRVFMVNHADLTQGRMKMRLGRFGEIKLEEKGTFTLELRGLVDQMGQTIGSVFQPECRVDLFSRQCGVKAATDVRMAGHAYLLGDRVRVRNSSLEKVYALPIVNPDFINVAAAAATSWALVNAEVTSQLIHAGTAAARAAGWTGSVSQTTALAALIALPLAAATFTASYRRQGTSYMESRLFVSFRNDLNVELGNLSEAYSAPPAYWVLNTLTGPIPAGTTRVFMAFQFRRTFSVGEIEFTPGYACYFDTVTATVSDGGPVVSVVTDPGFDLTTFGSATAEGWFNYDRFIPMYSQDGFFGPDGYPFLGQFKTFDLVAGSGRDDHSDTISLIGGPVSALDIAAGGYVVRLEWLQANVYYHGAGDAYLRFYNAANAQVFASPENSTACIPAKEWQRRSKVIAVPATATQVRIDLRAEVPLGIARTYPAVGFARFSAMLLPATLNDELYEEFGNVEYEATTAGTTSLLPATTFSRTIGATVSDGSVTWTVRVPEHTFFATISAVTSRGKFTITGVNQVDEWFRWGLVRILTGDNEGVTMECVHSTALGEIDLILALPYMPVIGDTLLIQTGCDKYIDTCQAKFGNAINFRGEPYIPGSDTYFRVGNPSTRSR